MPLERKNLLCRYRYDPLDRLVDCTTAGQAGTGRFYLKNRLTTEIQGSTRRSIFQQEDQLLAQQLRQDDAVETTLLAIDQQRSVLHELNATNLHPLIYTPYGYQAPETGLLSLLGFNGERPDSVTGHYLLGNGYRAFNSVLMRFNSPDSFSPFGAGGLNSFAYCVGDPVNRVDPTGHTWGWLKFALRGVGLMRPSAPVAQPVAQRNPPVTAETIPSRQRPATPPMVRPCMPQNLNEKTAAWTTRDMIAVHNSRPSSRRGSHSYYFEQDEMLNAPSISRSPSLTSLPRSRSPSQSSWTIEDFSNGTAAARTRRAAIVLEDNDPGLLALRRRAGVIPPSYDDASLPTFDEALRDNIRRP